MIRVALVLAAGFRRRLKVEADIAKVLTLDEARRIAVNVAKLPGLLGATTEAGR